MKTSIKNYVNAALHKKQIIAENRKLAGVYLWKNNINKKVYIGSAVDLSKRLGAYFHQSNLERDVRAIHNALLKYGHENFTVEILEYCGKEELLEREQYYLDLLKPEYNELKYAYSTLERIVKDETREKLRLATAAYKKNNPLSEEALSNLRLKGVERAGVGTLIIDTVTKEIIEFTNQNEAAEFLDVSTQAIRNAKKRGSSVKERFLILDKTEAIAESGAYLTNMIEKAMEKHKTKVEKLEGQAVQILNTETKEVLEFPSRAKAGEYLGVTYQSITLAIKRGNLIKGIYKVVKPNSL